MKEFIHLTVAAICKDENDRYLMVEELSKARTPVINQAAGHVELQESIYDAAIRETLEETGWLSEPKYIVGIYHNLNTVEGKSSRQYLRICFYSELIKDTKQELDTNISDTHWLTAEEIFALPNPRSPMVKACLQDYLDGKQISLDILSTLS